MFAEYLRNETWQTVMPGVSVCNFKKNRASEFLPVELSYAHAEVFFCGGGAMTITRRNGIQVRLESREILLLSDCRGVEAAEVTEPLEGIVISVDQMRAGDTFRELCTHFGGLTISMKQVGEHMTSGGGIRAIPVSPWTRAVFYALRRLSREDQGSYCIMKTFELLYLICSQEAAGVVADQEQSGSLMNIAAGMKSYMEEHMDEKLTITDLSHRFHLSRTACKSAFRSCFGQPIHSWLLDRRMERAAELLERTKMPILQVAQSVGYTGVSQFNVAFRQRYGKSPREYRKMSVSEAF